MLANTALFLITLLAYILSRKRYVDLFTPLFVYVAVWCSCIILFRLRFIDYDILETKTILVIAGSMMCFVLGCLLAGKRSPGNPPALRVTMQPLEKAIRVLLFLSIAGLFFLLLRIAQTFGISAYLTDPNLIRSDYEELGHFGALLFFLSADYPLFICSVVHLLVSKRLRWFTAIGLMLPAVQGYLTVSRNNLAVPLISGAFVWFYYRGWRVLNLMLLRRLVLLFALICLYFVGVGFWYGKLAASSDYSYVKLRDITLSSEVALQLIDPYIYATGNFPTLQAAMGDVRGQLWGERTFFPIVRVLYSAGLLPNRPENANLEFYNVPIPFNASTYLFGLYEDFGTSGIIIYPLLLGFLSTRLYLKMRAEPNLFSIGTTAVLMAVIVYSVFIGLASMFQTWYCVIALLFISAQCSIRSRISDRAFHNTDRSIPSPV